MALERLTQHMLAMVRADLERDQLVLPSLPDVVVRLRRVMAEPGSGAADVGKVIEADPALSTRLLRIANSAYYHGGTPICDVRRAVVRLGHEAIRYLVTLVAVAEVFDVRSRPRLSPWLVRLWRHMTMVAAVNEVLAVRTDRLAPEVAMLAGLIHDIGVLPLLVHADRFPQLISEPRILEPLLKELHGQVGGAILTKWQLPTELIEVARGHEDLRRDNELLADCLDLTIVANLICRLRTDHPWAAVDWAQVPAVQQVGVTIDEVDDILRYAGTRVAELRDLFPGRVRAA
jgi:HD-like signal output (HDOD) protein